MEKSLDNSFDDLADEEREMYTQISLLNAYSIYFNKINNTTGGFFENINSQALTSTNKKIDSLHTELENYKKDPDSFAPSKIPAKYCLTVDDNSIYSDNIIPLLLRLVEDREWACKNWKIEI